MTEVEMNRFETDQEMVDAARANVADETEMMLTGVNEQRAVSGVTIIVALRDPDAADVPPRALDKRMEDDLVRRLGETLAALRKSFAEDTRPGRGGAIGKGVLAGVCSFTLSLPKE